MAHPFLKSIKPVNLLSFGPDTEEIELRPLNILIGPNGSGKSNLIELFRLLSQIPDRDPWSTVAATGGASEWIWKGREKNHHPPSISLKTGGDQLTVVQALARPSSLEPAGISYSIELRRQNGTFEVAAERFREGREDSGETAPRPGDVERDGSTAVVYTYYLPDASSELVGNLPVTRSILSLMGNAANIVLHQPRLREFAEELERLSFYRDWTFGGNSNARLIQRAGFDSNRLASDSVNLAQVLKAWRDRGEATLFEHLVELMKKFYEPIKDVDSELIGDYLRIMIKEEGLSSRTPAERLSDGTLRWLMLLIVLLDPAPPPVICIDEPELGLHPDMLPTLADLLVEASTRTQLIVTTHSRSLLDSFTDCPDAVCVCEKVDGSTVIQRLDKEQLKIWLDEYSLGRLWTTGEIGGNRW